MAKGDQSTIRKVVDYVKPGTRQWTSPDGVVLHFLTVIFADGDEGGAGNTADNIEKLRESLEALVGKPEDFDVTDNGEYNGVQQWKLRSWPGKPQVSSGRRSGGGGGMTNPQAALLAAANLWAGTKTLDATMLEVAGGLTDWLNAQAGSQPEEDKDKPTADEQATLAQVRQLRDLAYEMGYSASEVLKEIGTSDVSTLSKSDAEAVIEAWKGKLAEATA